MQTGNGILLAHHYDRKLPISNYILRLKKANAMAAEVALSTYSFKTIILNNKVCIAVDFMQLIIEVSTKK